MELQRTVKTAISLISEVEILNFTYTGNYAREILARITLGDSTNGISGVGGTYIINLYTNSVFNAPVSGVTVPASISSVIINSRKFIIEPLDNISIKVIGLSGDTLVNTLAILMDATPLTQADLTGTGVVLIDHNYGGTDVLAYRTPLGTGIDNADVTAYLKADYDADLRDNNHILGRTMTDITGRWERPLMLDKNDYAIVFYKQGFFGPDVTYITVS